MTEDKVEYAGGERQRQGIPTGQARERRVSTASRKRGEIDVNSMDARAKIGQITKGGAGAAADLQGPLGPCKPCHLEQVPS